MNARHRYRRLLDRFLDRLRPLILRGLWGDGIASAVRVNGLLLAAATIYLGRVRADEYRLGAGPGGPFDERALADDASQLARHLVNEMAAWAEGLER